jgi:hypothetical protein
MFRFTRMSKRPHHPYPPSAVRVLLYPNAGQGIHDVATLMNDVKCWVLDFRWNDGRRACFVHGRKAGLAAAPRERGVCGGVLKGVAGPEYRLIDDPVEASSTTCRANPSPGRLWRLSKCLQCVLTEPMGLLLQRPARCRECHALCPARSVATRREA